MEQAQRHDWTPMQFLQHVLKEEVSGRQMRNRLRRLRAAEMPYEASLEGFDFGFQNSVSKQHLKQLADLTWLESAYVYGNIEMQ